MAIQEQITQGKEKDKQASRQTDRDIDRRETDRERRICDEKKGSSTRIEQKVAYFFLQATEENHIHGLLPFNNSAMFFSFLNRRGCGVHVDLPPCLYPGVCLCVCDARVRAYVRVCVCVCAFVCVRKSLV